MSEPRNIVNRSCVRWQPELGQWFAVFAADYEAYFEKHQWEDARDFALYGRHYLIIRQLNSGHAFFPEKVPGKL